MGIASNGIVDTSGGTDTSDATAKAWDIKTSKTAYIATGSATGTGYFPAMMQFDGSTGWYSDEFTSVGNKVSGVIRFRMSTTAGTSSRMLLNCLGPTARNRIVVDVGDSSHADTDFREKVRIASQNSAGTAICRLYSSASVTDNALHTLFFAFDADAGTAIMQLDGVDAINSSAANHVAPTTGTLDAGASSDLGIGGTVAGAQLCNAQIGFVGVRDAYLTNWSDFMQTDGTPKDIDETTWAEWSGGSVTSPLGRPLFWHESGRMTENKGSAGAMTANGTIILAAASTWS